MEQQQNIAQEIAEIDAAVKSTKPIVLTAQQQMWIDYNALSGVITDIMGTGELDKDGREMTLAKMPVSKFAKIVGVDRNTLRIWRNTIPGFWDRVNERRKELAPQSRVQAFHERWYTAALSMKNWQISEAWAINFLEDYKAPKVKVEHSADDSWLNLVASKSKDVIEGEVVDGPKDNA